MSSVRIVFDHGARGMIREFTVSINSFTVDEHMEVVEIFFEWRPCIPNDRKLSRVFLDKETQCWYYDYHRLGTKLTLVMVEVLRPGLTKEELDQAASKLFTQTGQYQWSLPLD